jgi:hypothetical protein
MQCDYFLIDVGLYGLKSIVSLETHRGKIQVKGVYHEKDQSN